MYKCIEELIFRQLIKSQLAQIRTVYKQNDYNQLTNCTVNVLAAHTG